MLYFYLLLIKGFIGGGPKIWLNKNEKSSKNLSHSRVISECYQFEFEKLQLTKIRL